MLEVRDLHISFLDDGKAAVRGVNFTMGAGEVLGIVGESGSGKTLTARAILGLSDMARMRVRGEIRYQGQDLLTLSEQQMQGVRGREIAMVFQEPQSALNPLRRISAQAEEVLRIHTKLSKRERRARVLAAFMEVGISDAATVLMKYPHELSGGMCQRAMLAMTLLLSPRLLICDEPTTALDVTTQAHILRLLKTRNEAAGTAMLFISHDLHVMRRVATRVLVMQAGQIVEAGDVAQIFRHPQHDYTKRLLASKDFKRGERPWRSEY